ncbi:MAG: hypothetical protein JRF33_27435, partial [Deltaproteobacteria bacterium]|nr:hypothetical protein [Deltaproteobacteria bacterium]
MQGQQVRIILGLMVITAIGNGFGGFTVCAAEDVEPPVESTAVSDFPGDLWGDIIALPTTENAWWLLGGTTLTIIVHQFEDPEGAARALNKGALDGISDFGNIWGDMRVEVPLAL